MADSLGQPSPKSAPLKEDKLFAQVMMLAEHGHTEEFICKCLQIPITAWKRWKRESPEFEFELSQWKKRADERVEKALYERAIGYCHPEEKIFCSKEGFVTKVESLKHYPPDPTAAIFWLKNRQPKVWRDRIEHAHEGEVEVKHSVKAVDIEERTRLLLEADEDFNRALE